LFAGFFMAYAARKGESSGMAPIGEALISGGRRSPTSTAPDPAHDEAYWAAQLPGYIRHWAATEDADEVTPLAAARGLGAVLEQAGRSGFLVLYDLLTQKGQLPVASACTLLRSLGQSKDSIVRSYRGRLIREALRHPSPAVRDAAALAIYEGGVRPELPALLDARDNEPNVHVRRGMSEILDALA
jgi:hypothetical protein